VDIFTRGLRSAWSGLGGSSSWLGWRSGSTLRRGVCATVMWAGVALSAAGLAQAAPDTTTLVSRASGKAGALGNGYSVVGPEPVSASGRFVAFMSTASNLAPEDRHHRPHVLVRDMRTSTTTLVSRASGASGAPAKGSSLDAAISANGQFVAFDSDASNLNPDDRDRSVDVYVRDLVAKTTTLVSRADGRAGAKANSGNSAYPAISANGRFVAFVSRASNLTADDPDDLQDVFLRDRATGTTTLASRDPTGAKCSLPGLLTPQLQGPDYRPSVSADGRFVAFFCYLPGKPDGGTDPGSSPQLFVRDMRLGTTTLVSRSDGPEGAPGSPAAKAPGISEDGRLVAFAGSGLLTPDASGVFVRNLDAASTTLVSRPTGADRTTAEGTSYGGSLSADGSLVAFYSNVDNLTADHLNSTSDDVYVRDQALATTMLVSRASGTHGATGNGDSYDPSISADGHFVAFGSLSTDLTSDRIDPNKTTQHVYLRELGPTS
jgi:Tol biopolymer transport system component